MPRDLENTLTHVKQSYALLLSVLGQLLQPDGPSSEPGHA